MRRVAALLILLAGGWSQVLASHCAMGLPQPHPSAAGGAAAEVHESGHHGDAHGSVARAVATGGAEAAATDVAHAAGTDAAGPPPSPWHHTDAGCSLLLPCVSGLLPAAEVGPAAASPAVRSQPLPRSAAAADLDRLPLDPPPPRLPV